MGPRPLQTGTGEAGKDEMRRKRGDKNRERNGVDEDPVVDHGRKESPPMNKNQPEGKKKKGVRKWRQQGEQPPRTSQTKGTIYDDSDLSINLPSPLYLESSTIFSPDLCLSPSLSIGI